eukprot:jgi/Chrzof1/13787/Cz08g12130.t1
MTKKGKGKPDGKATSKGSSAAAAHAPSDQQNNRKSKQQLKANLSARASHDQLERELAALGLRVKKITADGNCFFRALGDQLKAGGTT